MKSSAANNPRVKRLGRALLISVVVSSGVALPNAQAGDSAVLTRAAPTRLPSVSVSASTAVIKPVRLADRNRKPVTASHTQIQRTSAEIGLPEPQSTQPQAITAKHQTDWLRSGSSSATNEVARQTLSQAHNEFRVGAWLSAETSAWESIRWSAESIDQNQREAGLSNSNNSSTRSISKLQVAKQAIMEARDFALTGESHNPAAISRMATSHQTDVLDDQPIQGLSSTDASDRYLDFARVQLAAIASQSIEAAEALDLLAAIYLRRADTRTLPSATAICLRRAAIQGQPGNASLAANLGMHLIQVGLYSEARWALEHSLSIEPNIETANSLAKLLRQTGNRDEADAVIASVDQQQLASSSQPVIKVPEITQLTPDEFAALSKSVVWSADMSAAKPPQTKPADVQSSQVDLNQINDTQVSANHVKVKLTSSRVQAKSSAKDVVIDAVPNTFETVEPTKPSPFQRLKNSWRRLTD